MKVPARALFISCCALIGAVCAVTFVPPVLDALFSGLTQLASKPQQPSETAAIEEPAPAVAKPKPPADFIGPRDARVLQIQAEREAKFSARGKKLVAAANSPNPTPTRYDQGRQPITMVALALLGLILGGGVGSSMSNAQERLAATWEKMATGDKVTLFMGVFAGIIVSMPFLSIFQSLGAVNAPVIVVGMVIGLSALSVYALKTMEEALPWYSSSVRRRKTGIKVLDTNVLIDGRVYDLVRTGFIEGEIYVPAFVLQELQHIADSHDSLRRQRGRRGLEVLRRIQAEFQVEVGTHDRFAPDAKEEVDARLVRLAKAIGADLVSNDFNLNRVATIQEVRVMNINDLALALRPNVLPGEPLDITVIKEGNQYRQGVGYLDDGTMVVVENGVDLIGQAVKVRVTQVIQTERGKMIFADANGEPTEPERSGRRRHQH
ncbi:MAG: TRAM domain-containing protein [Fimbriimonadaceae bacterium]|nr:TRAM domain-containing protein [Fimbriimonadaceae bacterium]